MDRVKLARSLGVAGVSVLVLALVVSLGGLSLANPASVTYYYYETPEGNINYINLTAVDETFSYDFWVGDIPTHAELNAPGCTVKLLVGNLTPGQLSYLGARELRTLVPIARMDIMSSYTGSCGATLYFIVPNKDIRAYYWTGGAWRIIPGQTIAPYDSAYRLTVPIPNGFTGTPVILASPPSVGGSLALTPKTKASLALLAAGLALIAVAAAMLYAERAKQPA